jgi:hypothetical protein
MLADKLAKFELQLTKLGKKKKKDKRERERERERWARSELSF